MSLVVFSLQSDDAARLVDRELKRNGVHDSRILDRLSRNITIEAANDSALARELDREVAKGRVLIEVEIDEQNQPAVERMVAMLAGDARKFVIARAGGSSVTASNEPAPAV
jgi:hypothetical protein